MAGLRPFAEWQNQRGATGEQDAAATPPASSLEATLQAATGIRAGNVNMNRSAPLDVRAGGGFTFTEEGLRSYLESEYGEGNVASDASGWTFIRDEETNEWFPYNPAGLDIGDVVSLGGEALRVLPTLFTRRPLPTAVAGGTGSIAAQIAAEAVPGDSGATPINRLADIGMSAGLAGGGQVATDALIRGFDRFARPHNYMARYLDRRLQSPTAQQGLALERQFGTTFSPAQLTMSRGLAGIEAVARRHPLTTDAVTDQLVQQREAIVGRLTGLLNQWSPGGAGSFQVGQRVEGAFNNALDSALALRSRQATQDFGFLDQQSGGAGIFGLQETVDTINRQIERFSTPGAGAPAREAVGQLRALLRDLTTNTRLPNGTIQTVVRPIRANEMQNLLQLWGDAAKGTGSVLKDIETSQARRIASDLFGALNRDLDAAVQFPAGSIGQAEAELLRIARDNYRTNSAPINELGESILGRILGGTDDVTPERLAERFANMRPSEVRQVYDLIAKTDQGAADSIKANLLESAIMRSRAFGEVRIDQRTGMPGMPSPGDIKPRTLIENLQNSPVWGVLNAQEKTEMTLALGGLERTAFQVGDGSPTAPLQWAMELVRTAGGAIADPRVAVQVAAGIFAPQKIAQAMLTHEGRQAVATLTTTGSTPKKIAAALAFLGTLDAFVTPSEADAPRNADLDSALSASQSGALERLLMQQTSGQTQP